MRTGSQRSGLRLVAVFAAWLLFGAASQIVPTFASGATPSPVEAVRRAFPAVATKLDRRAALEAATWHDRDRTIEGFLVRSRPDDSAELGLAAPASSGTRDTVRVLLPVLASDPLVAEGEGVRVTRRPLRAAATRAQDDDGRLVYEEAWPSTEVLQAAGPEWTEEFFYLRAPSAPREFAYEVEAVGAAMVAIEDGDVRFLDSTGRGLVLTRPFVVDAAGRRSATAARWALDPEDQRGARRLTLHLDPRGSIRC